jgi:hypothetical protein
LPFILQYTTKTAKGKEKPRREKRALFWCIGGKGRRRETKGAVFRSGEAPKIAMHMKNILAFPLPPGDTQGEKNAKALQRTLEGFGASERI